MGEKEYCVDELVSALSEKLHEDMYLEFSADELNQARKEFEGTLLVKMFGGKKMKRNVFTYFHQIMGAERESVLRGG